MEENKMVFGEKEYNEVLRRLGPELKKEFLIEGLDSEGLPILKDPKEFTTGKDTTIENKKYLITTRDINNKKYFIVIRSSGKYFGEDISKKTITDIDNAVPYEISNNNICIGYFLTDQNKGYYTGSERLAKIFSGGLLKKEFIPTNKKEVDFNDFINRLLQIQGKYHIEIETIAEAQNVGYKELETIIPDENSSENTIGKKLRDYPNKLIIKSLNLKEDSPIPPKAFLKITFSLSKLSEGKKSQLKIARLTHSKSDYIFKKFYTAIKEYNYISVDTTEREKLEYFLIKHKILKNSIDREFDSRIKEMGIALEKGKYIILKINSNKLKETIRKSLEGTNASLEYGPIKLDTKNLLFYARKKETKTFEDNILFKINANNMHINLLILGNYKTEILKKVLEEPLSKFTLIDPEKYVLIARSSYLFPFIVADLKGIYIKYFKEIPGVSSTPQTPFLLLAQYFLSDIKGALKNALENVSIKTHLNENDRQIVASILYDFFKFYNNTWKSKKDNKKIGTYMERVFYAFLLTLEGEKVERLGGKNEPDAKLEDKENKILYLFDTKNLKSSSIIDNIKEKKDTERYKFTFERYASEYLKKYPNNEWKEIRFLYIINEKSGSETESKITKEIIERCEEISRKNKKDIKAGIITFEELYTRVKERKLENSVLWKYPQN